MYEQHKGKELAKKTREQIRWENRFTDEVALGLFQSWYLNKWISYKEYLRLTELPF